MAPGYNMRKKANQQKQCDALGKALLGNSGSEIHVDVNLICTAYLNIR